MAPPYRWNSGLEITPMQGSHQGQNEASMEKSEDSGSISGIEARLCTAGSLILNPVVSPSYISHYFSPHSARIRENEKWLPKIQLIADYPA